MKKQAAEVQSAQPLCHGILPAPYLFLLIMQDNMLQHAPLGHDVAFPQAYDPLLLFPISRSTNRQTLPIPAKWYGADIWNAYELSWLTPRGKPVVAVGQFTFPYSSPSLVESKSFKLYLNSFSEERYVDAAAVSAVMRHDLEKVTGQQIAINIVPLSGNDRQLCQPLEGINIDAADIEIEHYSPAPERLACLSDASVVTETLVSDLLKSNCPVTGQPDWASVQIRYTGPQINREALLEYIVSLRRHTEFHEHCVEKMFCDIWAACAPQALFVRACYTRRGGLDINPWRSSEPAQPQPARTIRQ